MRERASVNYGDLDPYKKIFQQAAASTSHNLEEYFGYHEVAKSRGESAYVWYEGDRYQAMVTEGLGTKNIAADQLFEEIRANTNILSSILNDLAHRSENTHYDSIAQDAVAMIVNDLIVVGAMPKVVTQHLALAESSWFKDNPKRAQDLARGWAHACNLAGSTWGGGETPQLKGILQPGTIELSGSAVGEIKPLKRLTLGEKLQAGDFIIYLPSSGIHANGLTDAREIGELLKLQKKGYLTKMANGATYGEALLTPTPIYVSAVRALFQAGVDIHYMSNITGHGLRKLMRADKELTYVMAFEAENIPEIFRFMQSVSGKSDKEMYATFNMGVGFAIYIAKNDLGPALKALQTRGWPARLLGHVEEGPKQVVIKPLDITFEADSLDIR